MKVSTFLARKGMDGPVIGEFIIRLSLANEFVVNIEAFRVVGEVHSEGGVEFDPPRKEYERKGATNSMDTTPNLDEAQRVIEGSIKWDGCSNLNFFPDEKGYVHFCGKNGAVVMGNLLAAMYDEAKELMGPKAVHDVELFEG